MTSAQRQLVSRWRQAGAITVATTLLLVAVLISLFRYQPSQAFLAGVGFVGGGYLLVVQAIDRRYQQGAFWIPVATAVTAGRGACAVTLAGFLVASQPDGTAAWIPALLFGGAALFDSLDGFIARATDTTSAFGGRIDVETDALALLIGTAVAVRFGDAPLVFLAVGIARYAFLGAIGVRRARGLPVSTLPPRLSRRALGATGMIATFVILSPALTGHLSHLLAVGITIGILLGFGRDWLLVAGRI